MAKIITVHGTNAGHADDEGQRWWQRGSEFEKRLSTSLNPDATQFEPFHWGEGPNSELERRKAGDKLLRELRKNERAEQDYCLIGHSHGGSVIHHALLAASARGINLPHLRTWITIGTPFLWTKPHWLLFRRLSNMGKVVYVYIIMGLASFIFAAPLYYFYGRAIITQTMKATTETTAGSGELWKTIGVDVTSNEQIDLFIVGLVAILLILYVVLLGFIIWSQRRIRRYYSARTRTFFKQQYIPLWRPFWSRADEAINGLRATEPLKLRLFRRNILIEPTKALFVLVFTLFFVFSFFIAIFLLFKYGLSPEYVNRLFQTWNWFGLSTLPEFTDVQRDPVNLLAAASFAAQHPILVLAILPIAALVILEVFLLIWLIFLFAHIVAYVVGVPASAFLNRLTADQLRNSAFGNDTIGEQVVQVAPVPEDCDAECARLPDDIEGHLAAYSDRHAAIALKRVRDILGVSEQLPGKDDIVTAIAEELSSNELIHVAYFEVEEFAKLIASALQDIRGVTQASLVAE